MYLYLLKKKGEVVPFEWLQVHVQTLGSRDFTIKLDPEENQVRHLKRKIQDHEGTPIFSQQLFSLVKTGESNTVSENPMIDEYQIMASCQVVLSVFQHECVKEERTFPRIITSHHQMRRAA